MAPKSTICPAKHKGPYKHSPLLADAHASKYLLGFTVLPLHQGGVKATHKMLVTVKNHHWSHAIRARMNAFVAKQRGQPKPPIN